MTKLRLLAGLGLALGCMGATISEEGEPAEPIALGGLLVNDLVPIPPEVPRVRPYPQNVVFACPAPTVLFVNFDGGALTGGQACNDAKQRCSFIVSQASVNYPAFSGTATQKQQILQLVTQYFAPFNVQVVTTMPTAGAYEMSMVGGVPQTIGLVANAAGVAPLDCGNYNASDISFAFSEVTRNDPHDVAVTIAQEAAHGFGLGHVNYNRDIMYPALTPDADSFHNSSYPIYDIGVGLTSDCTGTGLQNPVALLNANVGPVCTSGAGGMGGVAGMAGAAGTAGTPGGGAAGAGGSPDSESNPPGGNTSDEEPYLTGHCTALPGSATDSFVGSLSLLLLGLAVAIRLRK